VFMEVLHFPASYGRSMDALVDCLTYADEAELWSCPRAKRDSPWKGTCISLLE
jgi:hypothetical protein